MSIMTELPIFDRTRRLLGDTAMDRLANAKVIIFGVGGVGSWCAECLVRTGIGHLTLVDADTVSVTNINRQSPATLSTVGQPKAAVMQRRLTDINPDVDIQVINGLYTTDTADQFDLSDYDYVIDAIDSLRDKALLIINATSARTRLFSSMGAALKTDPTRIHVGWWTDVKGCPLAAALRRRFKRDGNGPRRRFKCVYSDELVPNRGDSIDLPHDNNAVIDKAQINGSLMQATATFGLILASLVINDLTNPRS